MGITRQGPHSTTRSRLRQWALGVVAGQILMSVAWGGATAAAAAPSSPSGWAAHSAYGVQVSVPRSWAVASFQNCPVRDSGTLLIGTPSVLSYCTFIPSDANIVWMQSQDSFKGGFTGHGERLVVGGLHVIAYPIDGKTPAPTTWVIPSRHVVLNATGPNSLAVLHTLTKATPRAIPAPGMLRGSEYLIALTRAPVSGPITVTRLTRWGPVSTTVRALDAAFWDTFAPGRYVLTGHDGDAACAPVSVVVRSGQTSVAPEIDCQGE